MVWRVKTDLKVPIFVTSDTIYLRFIDDWIAEERNFGLKVNDKEDDLRDYVGHLKYARDHHNIRDIIVAFNNNCAGFVLS